MVDVMRPEDDIVVARGVLEVEPVLPRQVVTTHGVAEVEPAWPQDEVVAHGVVDDESRDGPRDVPKHPDARHRSSSRRRSAQRVARRACASRSSDDER
jgi:hypothetical protein